RDFVQTLTKTFAHLPIGLAIFVRRRQLALFNPALTDLTTLPVDFLSSKPTLHAFLDRLRDRRMTPEPRDYKGWREHIAALEAAATDKGYEETWALPTGRTYRITGRPHPNGAVAFQFEDITSEISLTRRFRSELEMGQAVFDSLSEAIAVFSPGGPLTISNAAYVALWGVDPSTTLGDINGQDAVRHWSAGCAPSPFWDRVEHFLNQVHGRDALEDAVDMKDGRRLLIRLTPLMGGATLIRFTANPVIRAETPVSTSIETA
ncbi:MAG: PAS-domain containing protein, partial [Halocynthiibacter sp.]